MTAVLIITIELLEGRLPSLPERHTAALRLACPQKTFFFREYVLTLRILKEFLALFPISMTHVTRSHPPTRH